MTEKLKLAKALADELDSFSDSDRSQIKEALGEVSKDTPATDLAAIRLKKILGKATDTAGKALWKIAVELATEAARRSLLG